MAVAIATLIALWAARIPAQRPDDAQAILSQAMNDFVAGRVADSIAGFDRVISVAPDAAPQLWQRGIALYYANRFRDCRAQFELHRKVNPNDVENAAWHYLCVARSESPDRAKAALLPVGADPRVPMREIYRMFRGDIAPESVLVAAGNDPTARFYAALYVGLYHEANGIGRAQFYISDAARDEFMQVGGYMNRVARVHMQVRGWTAQKP